jgi:hypothetical protein
MQIDIGGSSSFFVMIFLHFGKNMFPHKFPAFLGKKKPKETKNIPKKPKFCHNCLQDERVLKVSTSKFG